MLCWQVSAAGIQACAPPRRFNPASSFDSPKSANVMAASKRPAYGVASSGNGLVMAVVRTTGTFQEEVDQGQGATTKMTWSRVAAGSVHLYTPFGAALQGGPAPPCGPVEPLLPRLTPQLTLQWPSASSSWDLAAASLSGGWGAVEGVTLPLTLQPGGAGEQAEDDDAMDVDGEGAGGAGGGGDDATADQGAVRQRVQAIKYLSALRGAAQVLGVAEQAVGALEERYLQESGLSRPSPSPLSAITAPAWRGLHSASLLRHTVLSYLSSSQQLDKALAALAPLLAGPDGSDPPPLDEEAAEVAAAGPGLPPWLFGAGARAALAAGRDGPALRVPALLEGLRRALGRGEMQLMQLHVWRALGGAAAAAGATAGTGGGPAGKKAAAAAGTGAAGAGAGRRAGPHPLCLGDMLGAGEGWEGAGLWRQLMADWVRALPPGGTRRGELLPLLAAGEGGGAGAGAAPPCRETSGLVGAAVCVLGPDPIQAARCARLVHRGGQWRAVGSGQDAQGAAAQGPAPGEVQGGEHGGDQGAETTQEVVLEVPRCGATFMLCEASASWHCPACRRRYLHPPVLRPEGLPDVPHCVVCAVRLASAAASNSFLSAPAVQLQPIPPEPIVIT